MDKTNKKGGPREFFVATDGMDRWSGACSKPLPDGTDGPFATIQRARDAIRSLKQRGQFPSAGVTVSVDAGIYHFENSLVLNREDSGLPGGPVIYKGRQNGKARLVGGRRLHKFTRVTDRRVLARLSRQTRGKIWQCDLKAAGITNYGRLTPGGWPMKKVPSPLELFFNRKPMILAEWPNRAWARIAAVSEAPSVIDESGVQRGAATDRFTYAGDRPGRWQQINDIWLHGFWMYDWADEHLKIKAIDTAKRTIFVAPPQSRFGYKQGQRYRVLNVLEELDRPGEWYLDRLRGILYFWPPSSIEKGEALVSLLREPFIEMRDVSHVQIDGLAFECGRSNGIQIDGGSHVSVRNCTVQNLTGHGIIVQGGLQHRVENCEIEQTGLGGIILEGGNRKTLAPAGHVARNNHIHHFARWVLTYSVGVKVGGVGNRVSRNLIHHAPHTGIMLAGNDHQITGNELHHLCQSTGDAGAFYMGRDWTMRGNVVRHNYFHHLGGLGIGSMAVYLDDLASGTRIYGNVFYKVWYGILLGGGRDNRVENNIFVDCRIGLHVDSRGVNWARQRIESRRGSWDVFGKLEAIPFQKPPYSTKYPKLARILENEPLQPLGNVIARNIHVGKQWLDLRQIEDGWLRFEKNFTEGDPRFAHQAKADFRLRPDSPARRTGFKAIPFDKIGISKRRR